MNDPPRYKPERDRRVSDPLRFLEDRQREAVAMIALWNRSTKSWACSELWHWQRVLEDLDRQIDRLFSPDEDEENGGGCHGADEDPDEHGYGETEGIELVDRHDE
jgi:hypothetical protein